MSTAAPPGAAAAPAPRRGPSRPLPAGQRLRPLNDPDFALFQALIYREAGIALAPAKKALVARRLGSRLRALGMVSFRAYYRLVKQDAGERVAMLDAITTNETQFFREPRQFQLIEGRLAPAWKRAADAGRRSRRLRAWCAACASGEEPYSLAMALSHHLPSTQGWQHEILATDLSTRVLAAARSAVWPVERAEKIPPHYLHRYMLRGVRSQQGKVKVAPEIRRLVHFRRLNLAAETYPVQGPFDLILCRNVLIYFDVAARQKVIERLLTRLAPDGYLLLGHAENLHAFSDRLTTVIPSVYTRCAGAPAAR